MGIQGFDAGGANAGFQFGQQMATPPAIQGMLTDLVQQWKATKQKEQAQQKR